ncbi:hypothetical protein BAJUN_00440 [Bajunvirus bajun]|uniref:Uncharacterized protein n=1 Tax=Brevundimonas phage vB_BgoS-Bajun TaxID=2948594 RepID=A0A9E7SRW5_9CAUD|nr:hypothetical protein BAJUN_00440 [Brevundimonas phage vB_BgoS-Bajun]
MNQITIAAPDRNPTKRSWEEIYDTLAKVTYPGFEFLLVNVGAAKPEDDTAFLQIRCPEGTDTMTGAPMDWKGRKWQMSRWMTDTEIVQTAWAAVERALMHEAAELFRFKDQPIFDRHFNVHMLAELRAGGDAVVLDDRA